MLYGAGTLYLVEGQVVHAESPSAPGIDVLLTACGRLTGGSWREAVDRRGALGGVGRFHVGSGRLSDAELEICHLGTLFDAAHLALGPGSGPRGFYRGAAHWLGPVRPVGADTVERETRCRHEPLAGLWPYPQVDQEPVVASRPDAHAPPVTRRQRAVPALADGVRTPTGIARALGRPAFHTLIDMRRLAAAGHVATPRPRTPGPPTAGRGPLAAAFAEPDATLLRRLRDDLEAHL
ncbi:transcriptional regulator [Streptomyces sp. ME19-01-6]|nr:transcriptional regulator [Streptomyces sp. ME19-01-6]MDX3227868.1 transcriptional regulator [Streptomyces sp. ME19-01-6]